MRRSFSWWLENRGKESILLVVSDGEIHADATTGRFNPEGSSAVPPVLAAQLTNIPKYSDAREAGRDRPIAEDERFRKIIYEIVAPLRGLQIIELESESLRQHRRTRRLTRTVIAALTTLLLIATAGGGVALWQRNVAVDEARQSLARQLSATAIAELNGHTDIANLLAAQAFRTDPSPQTRAALLQVTTANPYLVKYLPFEDYVTSIEPSADSSMVVAGLRNGQVLTWTFGATRPEVKGSLSGPITQVAVSADGSTVAATTGQATAVWSQGVEPWEIDSPQGLAQDLIAVVPSGKEVLVQSTPPDPDGPGKPGTIDVYDVSGRAQSARHDIDRRWDMWTAGSDDEITLMSLGGPWERRSLPTWTPVAQGSVSGYGVYGRAWGLSSTGRYFTYTNASDQIPVWTTDGPTEFNNPTLTANAPVGDPSVMTISPDGSHLAVADAGVVHVAPLAPAGTTRGPTLELREPAPPTPVLSDS